MIIERVFKVLTNTNAEDTKNTILLSHIVRSCKKLVINKLFISLIVSYSDKVIRMDTRQSHTINGYY